jgi:hypothetical protein
MSRLKKSGSFMLSSNILVPPMFMTILYAPPESGDLFESDLLMLFRADLSLSHLGYFHILY